MKYGNPPHRLAVNECHFGGAGIDRIDRDVGRRFRAAEHDDLASFGDLRIVVLRRVHDAPALRLERLFAGQAERLGLIELPRAYGDEIEVFVTDTAVRPPQVEPPARPGIGATIHLQHGRVEADRTEEVVIPCVLREIGVDLRALRPLRIGFRHRLVGVTVEILRALRLHLGIGPRRLPDAAEIAAALDNRDQMTARGESLRRREPRYAGADDTNLFSPDHDNVSSKDRLRDRRMRIQR